jgi:hypothetical protein
MGHNCKILSTAAAFVIHNMLWKSQITSNARTLWYGEKLKNIARKLDFSYIFKKLSSKL